MADKRRFEYFAVFLVGNFTAPRIYDVAGGMGKLNEELTSRGRSVTTFDCRQKRLEVNYVTRPFTLDEACDCDLIVGMHPDGATRLIIEYAAKNRIPFSVVPCCSDNSMSYRPWIKFLVEFAEKHGFQVEKHLLPMTGRAMVVSGRICR